MYLGTPYSVPEINDLTDSCLFFVSLWWMKMTLALLLYRFLFQTVISIANHWFCTELHNQRVWRCVVVSRNVELYYVLQELQSITQILVNIKWMLCPSCVEKAQLSCIAPSVWLFVLLWETAWLCHCASVLFRTFTARLIGLFKLGAVWLVRLNVKQSNWFV